MSTSYQALIQRLDAFIRKFYKNQLLRGAIYTFTLTLAFYLIVTIAEYFGHFGSTSRTILFYLFVAGMIFIIANFIAVPLMHLYRFGRIISHEQAAEIIGRHFGNVQDKLLNILQLKKQSEENNSPNQELLIAGIDQKINELKPVPFVSAVDFRENRKYLRFAVIPLAAFIIILFTAPSLIKDSTKRLIEHETYFEKPAPFSFQILNKELKTVQQQDFQLDVSIKGNEVPAEIYIEIGTNQFKLDKENLTTFHYLFRNIQHSETFRLAANGFYSKEYTIEALPNPVLTNFHIAVEYPAYVKKPNETLQNTGDLVIPAGTKVKWTFNTKNTEAITMSFHDTTVSLNASGENNFSFVKHFLKNDSYSVIPGNHFLTSKDSIRYAVSVIPDLYPSINIEQQQDSLSYKRTFFKGLIKDDYGFSKLTFNYKFLKSNDTLAGNQQTKEGKEVSENIAVNKSLNTDQFFYSWDLATVNVAAGDEVEYYFEVWDNDGVNGPKSTKSQSQVFKAPTLKELDENAEKNNADIKNDLKESIAKAKSVQKDLNDLAQRMLDKTDLSYEDKKKAADLLEKQKELEKKLAELRNKNDQKNREQEEYKKTNEDILQKQEQLQSIMDKLQSPELKKLMDKLQEMMLNVDKNQLQQQLSEMKLDNKDLQKELERTIELFKQMEFDQKLQQNIDKLNDLAKKQDDLSKKTDDKNSDSKDMKEKQDVLNKDFDQFRKDMDDLAKKNDELEEKKDLEKTDQQEEDIQKEMQNSSDQLGENKSSKASKSQKNASQKMQQMAEKMNAMQQKMEQEENEEDMASLRALLENLLRMSFNQEQVMQDLKSIDINNPQYLKLSQQQAKLKDDAKLIEDSLFALSKRVMQIEAKVNQEISSINQNMDESLRNLEDRTVAQARSRQQFVMTSVNNLTLMLSEALQQMQQQQAASMSPSSCKKPGKKKGTSMSELAKMQEELNKNMQKAKEQMKQQGNKPDGKQGQGQGQGMSEQLAKMAAQQEFIRNELNKINQEQNKDGKNSLGNLEDIARQMEETEKDIVNKMLSDETLKRQQDIKTRMLESDKAEKEREQDEQRKSEESKKSFNRNPEAFDEYKRLKLKEMELLRTVPPALNSYYRQKVNDYFQSIDK